MNSKTYTQPKLGIIGGGQLGRMLIQEAINYNVEVHVIDPDANAPCKNLCKTFTNDSYRSYSAVYHWGIDKPILTIEFEDINADALTDLDKLGVKVHPSSAIIKLVQDKGLQKEFYVNNGIPTAPFYLVEGKNAVLEYKNKGHFFQKLRKSGYDGKGVKKLTTDADWENCFTEPSVIEELVTYEKELSVIVARNAQGEIKTFPTVEMYFNPVANLVEFLFSPAQISTAIDEQAQAIAHQLAEKLELVGVLAVELFLTTGGQILVNEIAPRPHNSGHQSIEGNTTSQYAQHLRAILGLPLGDTAITQPSVMVNLLGEPDYSGDAVIEGFDQAMAIPGVYVHLYGKKQTKPYRKMGHVTVLAPTHAEALAKAKQVKEIIKIKA